MVIGLAGSKLAGKGTAAAHLCENYGAVSYTMSAALTDILARLHIDNSRANLVGLVGKLREQFGEDILAQALRSEIAEADNAISVIDGIRMPMEVEVFSQLPDFHLLYIDAPERVRYERQLLRGEKVGESDMSFEQFQEEEKTVTEVNTRSLKEKAGVAVLNNSTYEELYTQLDTFMQSQQ